MALHISHTVRVAVAPGRVWSALTSPAELLQWYAPGCRWEIGSLERGATLRFFNTETNIQVAIVEESEAPHRLTLRWIPDPLAPATSLVSTYVVRAAEDGSIVEFTQCGYESVPAEERAAWIAADEGALPAIASALVVHLNQPA
jgi:uncharacterized protein YndB with AHSA1/START domain